MFKLFPTKTPSCGLDLGSSWCKMTKLARKGKDLALERFGRLPWSGQKPGDFSLKGKKIKDLWTHLALKDKIIVSSLAGHAVIVKRVFIKAPKDNKIEQYIIQQAEQYIPFDVKDVHLDYHILDQDGHDGNNLEVILVASKIKVVQELTQVMDYSGLNLNIVDVDSFALSNCFEFNYPELTQDPAYLLDIGGRQSIFVVFWRNQPLFFREMSFGGRQLTEAIAKIAEVGTGEAERIKLQGTDTLRGEEKERIYQSCEELLRSWSREIKRMAGFYQTSVKGAKQAEILFLSGGGSMFSGIRQVLEDELNIETRHLDPWKNIHIKHNDFDLKYLEAVKPQFAVSTGLALRGFI